MNASALKVSVPKLTPDERQGLQDFWKVYEAHREEITSNLQEIASRHEEFKFTLQNTASEPTAEEQDRLNGYSLGANSYVQKPVDFDQFIGVVCQLGLYWLILNEAPPRQ